MSTHPIKSPRKLIEVALPLDVINVAAAREKSIRHGHPSTMHLWWARRPLAAARAVIFAQMVNDPGYQQGGGFKYGKNKKEAAEERKRLFRIMEELVQWENTTNERVLEEARSEIRRSWREICDLNRDHPDAEALFNPAILPGVHDPFAGGGTIPLEAQRLGLKAYASDLNPVAVLINKATIEIPPKFAGCMPVGPPRIVGQSTELGMRREWPGASGLAEDVRRYGAWMREEARKQIGHLYPPIEVTNEMISERPDLAPYLGQKLKVIAYLWARTVKSQNPAFNHIMVPLATTFVLSSKEGRQMYVEPIVEKDHYRFMVRAGDPPEDAKNGTKLGRGANFKCILSNSPMDQDYIRREFVAGRSSSRLIATVAEGRDGRIYISPTKADEELPASLEPTWKPEQEMETRSKDLISGRGYGFSKWHEIFTPRQLITLSTFIDLATKAVENSLLAAKKHGMKDDGIRLEDGGVGARAYAETIGVYLSFLVSAISDDLSTIVTWRSGHGTGATRSTFARQALPMVWDYAEANPFADAAGDLLSASDAVSRVISMLPCGVPGEAFQADAMKGSVKQNAVVSTDPPYYDNIAYADLSDFFYIWLRRGVKSIYPNIFSTMAVPKADELVATPYRHGGREQAEAFFLHGMTNAIEGIERFSHPAFPITIYYAFKQTETNGVSGTSSSGWEAFLEAVLSSGLAISGTWPMRTERLARSTGIGNNALASSIVLVCQHRSKNAPTISRREFIRELNQVLPEALDEMTKGTSDGGSPVAPVDLSQSIIGPGMAVFSKYAAVLEADGSQMGVRTALQLINRFLAEDDFDGDTQWCLHWFEQYGWKSGEFGQADVLARAKATSVDGLARAGVIEAGGGSVRLFKYAEYPANWDPKTDTRLPIWEALHQLIRSLKQGGETVAGAVSAAIPGKLEAVRQLAYRLYTLCERQGWAEDARAYNELITSWSGIESAASNAQPAQRGLFD